jgi:hypothetical protein
LSQKRQFFANFFGENILKIITSVPGSWQTNVAPFTYMSPWLCMYELATAVKSAYTHVRQIDLSHSGIRLRSQLPWPVDFMQISIFLSCRLSDNILMFCFASSESQRLPFVCFKINQILSHLAQDTLRKPLWMWLKWWLKKQKYKRSQVRNSARANFIHM